MAIMTGPTVPIDLARLQWIPMSTVPPDQQAAARAFTDRVADAILEHRRNDPNDCLYGQTGPGTSSPDPIQPLADARRGATPHLTSEQAYAQALEAAPADVQARVLATAGYQVPTRPAPVAPDATAHDPRMVEIDEIVDIMLRQHPGEFTREQAIASLLEKRPDLYARYLATW